MSKGTAIKDALKKLEEKGINVAEAEKVCTRALRGWRFQRARPLHCAPHARRKPTCHQHQPITKPHEIPGTKIELFGQCPPIEKMDAALSALKGCKCVPPPLRGRPRSPTCVQTRLPDGSTRPSRNQPRPHGAPQILTLLPPSRSCLWRQPNRHLALSTNNIEKIAGLNGLANLKILSLGRNLIKKVEGVDAVADTLEELWLSYNAIERLVRAVEIGGERGVLVRSNGGRDACERR